MRDHALFPARRIVALVTPFKQSEDGEIEIDYAGLRRLIEGQIGGGIEGILLGGTTAETATLSELEWGSLIGYGIAIVNGRVPVIAGTGTNSTKSTIYRTRFAASLGCKSALVVTPYYNKPCAKGLKAHFEAVAAAVPNIDIILYNVPSRTGVDLSNKTIKELACIENIVALKDASGDITRLPELKAIGSDKPFKIYSGNDDIANDTHNGTTYDGVISVTANILPKAFGNQIPHATPQDAIKLHQSLFLRPNPTPTKYLLSHLGIIQPIVRLPLVSLDMKQDPEVCQQILDAYTKVNSASPMTRDIAK